MSAVALTSALRIESASICKSIVLPELVLLIVMLISLAVSSTVFRNSSTGFSTIVAVLLLGDAKDPSLIVATVVLKSVGEVMYDPGLPGSSYCASR